MEEHSQARFIVETLAKAGFIAYYAGGWVRDLLLKHPSDDIDIATNAPPETIQALFPHTVPVGIAFGIVIVIVDGRQYEVATFRQDLDYADGRRPSRIVFATAAEDARRRDFTINGMFYDPLSGEIFDYVEGRADLEAKIIRAIGNPHERIKEDRLRMMRAVRLACRFGFQIEPKTAAAIRSHAEELFPAVAIERIWQELSKGHDFGKLCPMLIQLHEFGLLPVIFPSLKGVPLAQIEERLERVFLYPKEAPVIASLLPLFPHSTLEEELALCKQLKRSSADQQFTAFLHHARQLVCRAESLERADWAHFYAHPLAPMSLQILSAHADRLPFLKEHEERLALLAPWIERIQRREPVVGSEHLLKAGIQPGVAMGLLLKEAERIAINRELCDPKLVIEQLRRSPLWPN
ncbi:MAG: CCA tRNA nucleotidyltransferase [Chlamydiales bacterium]